MEPVGAFLFLLILDLTFFSHFLQFRVATRDLEFVPIDGAGFKLAANGDWDVQSQYSIPYLRDPAPAGQQTVYLDRTHSNIKTPAVPNSGKALADEKALRLHERLKYDWEQQCKTSGKPYIGKRIRVAGIQQSTGKKGESGRFTHRAGTDCQLGIAGTGEFKGRVGTVVGFSMNRPLSADERHVYFRETAKNLPPVLRRVEPNVTLQVDIEVNAGTSHRVNVPIQNALAEQYVSLASHFFVNIPLVASTSH